MIDDIPMLPPPEDCIYCGQRLPQGKIAACRKSDNSSCADKFAAAIADVDAGIPPWPSDQAGQDEPFFFTE